MSRVVIIVGMHRSGTSSLAGSLQEAGLFLGDVVTEAPHNAKGNRENRRIMDLHDDVLAHSGGSWDRPPEQVVWSDEHRHRQAEIIASYAGAARWGFKDPRTLYTLDGWLRVLPHVQFVGTFRHPLLVARSLQRRGGRPISEWLELWRMYNERLLTVRRDHEFPIVCFDEPDELYRRCLCRICADLGLEEPSFPDFFDPSLRHTTLPEDAALPAELKALYDELRALAVRA